MLDSAEFRELLITDVALVRDVAKAHQVAAALLAFWDGREGKTVFLSDELARIASIPCKGLRLVEEQVDRADAW